MMTLPRVYADPSVETQLSAIGFSEARIKTLLRHVQYHHNRSIRPFKKVPAICSISTFADILGKLSKIDIIYNYTPARISDDPADVIVFLVRIDAKPLQSDVSPEQIREIAELSKQLDNAISTQLT